MILISDLLGSVKLQFICFVKKVLISTLPDSIGSKEVSNSQVLLIHLMNWLPGSVSTSIKAQTLVICWTGAFRFVY